jgi:hypothetical protein
MEGREWAMGDLDSTVTIVLIERISRGPQNTENYFIEFFISL